MLYKRTTILDKQNILIIEPSETEAFELGELLSGSPFFNFDIFHAPCLNEAKEVMESEKIDVSLVNLFLPDSDGIHTFDQLFSSFPDIPFIVLTELDDIIVGINAVKKGAQDYLTRSELNISSINRAVTYAIERKHTEEQLRKSEEKYRELFLRSKDAIYMSTLDGKFIDVNPAGLSLLGYSVEDIDDLSVRDLYVHSSDREALVEQLKDNGEVSDYEVLLKTKDGKTHLHCILNTTVIKDKLGQTVGFQGIIKDITKRKEAEVALVKSLQELDFANKELQDLNASLEEKVDARTEQLQKEKEIVEFQNKEIRESINYAKRIQASILPPIKKIEEHLSDSFIYYEPKDIVSGDFYWFEHINSKPMLAVVDCTGHGVPGAFMSIIGYTQLNEIVNDHKLSNPGIILRELDKRVKQALNQNNGVKFSSMDGMELGLISIDYEAGKLEYAGAMRPLFFIKDSELHIVKGDKFSIGGSSIHKKTFTTHRLNFKKGDSFYLFSDGYPDQFGGPRGKKFMTKNVGLMLKKIAHLSMKDQGKIIQSAIKDWMQDEEQIDDILITGIKF